MRTLISTVSLSVGQETFPPTSGRRLSVDPVLEEREFGNVSAHGSMTQENTVSDAS